MRRPVVVVVVVVSLAAAMVVMSAGAAHADPPRVDFGTRIDFATRNAPASMAIGDLNGDGHLDLAVAASPGLGTVSVLLGDGTGSFGPQTEFGAGVGGYSVVMGDLNGDDHLDVAVANYSSDSVSVLLGDGTGSFGPQTDFATGTAPSSMAIGDLNGDSHLDLAVANADSGTVSVLLGDGTGSFGPKTDFASVDFALSMAMGDLNGDGHLDLAVANATFTGGVSVLLGDGTGSFGPKTDFATAYALGALAMGDLNGDGHLDVAASTFMSTGVLGVVLLGDGTGGFGPGTDVAGEEASASLVMGDLNGDSHLDLASTNNASNSVSVLLGDGTGGLGSRTDFATGSYPTSVAIGDLNGDGRPDLAVVNQEANSVSVLLNGPAVPRVPGAPTIVNATAGNQAATLSWNPPLFDGFSQITGYVVTPYHGGEAQLPVTFNSTATTQTITGLTTGDAYTFTVAATNAVGTGPESAESNLVIPGPRAPTAPTILRNATAANQSATVSWLAPASDGGSPVTGYVVTAYVGYASVKVRIFNSPLTTQTVTGLTNGTTYRFRVRAYNAYGFSGFSKVTNAVTPTP
jgi:FG-GAP-like repeat/Fibronectin type III domain